MSCKRFSLESGYFFAGRTKMADLIVVMLMAIDRGRWLPHSVTFIMDNVIFLGIETKIIDANNVDALDTSSEMTMARSKTWAILNKTRPNAWWEKMVRRVKRRNLQTVSTYPHLFFWRHFVSRCRGNEELVNHFIMNVPMFMRCYRV